MICHNLVTSMLATTDPYNSTEFVEVCWKELGFDWITGAILNKKFLSCVYSIMLRSFHALCLISLSIKTASKSMALKLSECFFENVYIANFYG